jgi:cell division protein FtsL
MKIKLIIILLCAIGALFLNFTNKHYIIKSTQEIEELKKILYSYEEINQDLLATNSKLLARDRIKKLASEELGMIFSTTIPQTISISDDEDYKLINFLVPTAEALNK